MLLACVYTGLVCAKGVPALRHDWLWPVNHAAFMDMLLGSFGGWTPSGMGHPLPYPGTYMIGPIVAGIGLAIGPFPAFVLFVVAIGITCALAARHLGRSLDAPAVHVAAIEMFALFNPWMYNKTVAGHLYMILAYGATFALLAELLRPKPRQRHIILLLLLELPQLQFFLIALAAVAIHAAVKRVALPLVMGIVIGSPIWIGIALDRSSLLQIPYTLAWETVQSVDWLKAISLRGYFPHYGHYTTWQTAALWTFVAFAVAAAAGSKKRSWGIIGLITGAAMLVIVTGTRGPVGGEYRWLVATVPETGVFRELYDILGFVAIVYALGIALSPSWLMGAIVRHIPLAAALVLASIWITQPPSQYWVSSTAVPSIHFTAPRNTRYALYPAFQPLTMHGKGSGVDPNEIARPGNVTPLDEYLASYPTDAALTWYAQTGNAQALERLSVSTVIVRPWLQTNGRQVSEQMSGLPSSVSAPAPRVTHLRALPEATIGDMPKVVSLANRPGDGNVLFSDTAHIHPNVTPRPWPLYPAMLTVTASDAFVDASKGWVSAAFIFASHPALAQGIGGAVTTNSSTVLPVRAGLATLVNVRGELLDSRGRVLFKSSGAYHWIELPLGVEGVRCRGLCLVAAQSTLQQIPPLNRPAEKYRRVALHLVTPWLAWTAVPENSKSLLRYDVAYDPNWLAFMGDTRLVHLRLDATVNGWLLPKGHRSGVVYVLYSVAPLQILCETLTIALLIAALYVDVRRAPLRTAAARRRERT